MTVEQFKEVLRAMLRFVVYDRTVKVVEESGSSHPMEQKLIVHLSTVHYRYHIVAIEREGQNGYLGCTVSNLTPLAGEDWTRGNDLADGPLTVETWEKIKDDIIAYEVLPLAPKIEYKISVTSGHELIAPAIR